MKHVKEQGIGVSEAMVSALVYATALVGDVHRAYTIVDSFSATFNSVPLYFSMALAHAWRGEIDDVLKALISMPSKVNIVEEEHVPRLLEILFVLLDKKHTEAFENVSFVHLPTRSSQDVVLQQSSLSLKLHKLFS